MGVAGHSSGDLLADRRFEYARAYAEAGEHAAAADLCAQALEIVPDWLPALIAAADALVADGRPDEALPWLRRAAALDADGLFGAGLKLAALGAVAMPDHPPAAYVRGLFDDYADRFETALVDDLAYRAPWLIAAALDAVRPGANFAAGMDLGCGTGLMAKVLAGRLGRFIGCDLSAEMTARAAPRYAEVLTGDVLDSLARAPGPYDLVTAADVFVYVGALDAVFAATRRALAPHGLFAFSVEEAPAGADLVLRDSLRYAHGEAYVRRLAAEHGFKVLELDRATLRMDRGVGVRGLACVLG